VSTQLDREVKGFDEVISDTDEDFQSSGLRTSSLARLPFLALLPRRQIIGAIGSISSTRHGKLLKTLSDYFQESGLTHSGPYFLSPRSEFWGVVHSRFTIYDLLVGAHPSFVLLPIIAR